MTQPTPFDRSFSFNEFASAHPTSPPPGAALDAEFNAIAETLDDTLESLALIQRDDGKLANGIVTPDALSDATLAQMAGVGPSAYEVAVAGGFAGDEAAWLASLVGPEGPSAYDIAVSAGYVGSEASWIAAVDAGRIATEAARDLADADRIAAETARIGAELAATNAAGVVYFFLGPRTLDQLPAGTFNGQLAFIEDYPLPGGALGVTAAWNAAAGAWQPFADLLPVTGYVAETLALKTAYAGTGTAMTTRRLKAMDYNIRRLKAKGIWAKLKALYVIADTEAQWMVNIRNPGTYNLTKVGSPAFVSRSHVMTGNIADYYDTNLPLSAVNSDDHAIGVFTGEADAVVATSTGFEMGVISGSVGLSLATNVSGVTNARSFGTTTVMTGSQVEAGTMIVSRLPASGNIVAHGMGATRSTIAKASAPIASSATMFLLRCNGIVTATSFSHTHLRAAFVAEGLTAQQMLDLHAILSTLVYNVMHGDLDVYAAGTAPKAKSFDAVVYGATPGGIAAAYEMKRQGKSVAIVGGWRERHVGGMSANGLGTVDIDNPASFGGLGRWVITRLNALTGRADTVAPFQPRYFKWIMHSMLDPGKPYGLDIPVFWSDGIESVSKTGARLNSFSTVDGRTVSADYFFDATYEGDLMALAGVSFITGREAAGTGIESKNGYQGSVGGGDPGLQFPVDVSPYIIAGDATSGLLPTVEPTPAKTIGQADEQTQAYNFRLTMTKDIGVKIAFSAAAPPEYDKLRYEPLLRVQAAVPDNAFNDFVILGVLSGIYQTFDVNARGAQSTDWFGKSNEYVAATTYDQRGTIWKQIENYTRGFFHLLANDPDSRIPALVRTDVLLHGYAGTHYLDPYVGRYGSDEYFWPPQLYVREFRRMRGSVIWDANDMAQTDGTVPRSIKTISTASYTFDSHHTQTVVDMTTGTARIRNTGSFEDVAQGAVNNISPLPIEIFLPVKSECENLAVLFCSSSTHVAFGSIRMELPLMQVGQAMAMAAKIAMNAGNIALQDVDYPTLRTALLASAALPGEVAPVLPQVN